MSLTMREAQHNTISKKRTLYMYQTVLFFDLDGTLMINPFESAVWPVVINEIAYKTNLPYTKIMAMIEDENDARQRDEHIAPIHAMDWDDITEHVARQLGVSITTNCTELVRSHATSHSSLLPHVHETLGQLQAPNRALVIATKGLAKYQRPVIDALGITHYFTGILTPDSYNGLKKHRRFFGDWPQRAHNVIMIGDMYHDDVLYPSQHGFKTIWKPNPSLTPDHLSLRTPFQRAQEYPYTVQQSVRPTAIINDLLELPSVIDEIERTAS